MEADGISLQKLSAIQKDEPAHTDTKSCSRTAIPSPSNPSSAPETGTAYLPEMCLRSCSKALVIRAL